MIYAIDQFANMLMDSKLRSCQLFLCPTPLRPDLSFRKVPHPSPLVPFCPTLLSTIYTTFPHPTPLPSTLQIKDIQTHSQADSKSIYPQPKNIETIHATRANELSPATIRRSLGHGSGGGGGVSMMSREKRKEEDRVTGRQAGLG